MKTPAKLPARLFGTVDIYLGSQLLPIILFAMVMFSIIWLAPDTLFKLIQFTVSGRLAPMQATEMFLYHLPGVLQQTIPIAVLLGSIFLFQRLSQSYELIAMLAAGISTARVLQSILWVGLIFGILQWVVQEYVIPHTAPRLEAAYIHHEIEDRPDRNFVFVEKNHQGQLDKFFMIGQTQTEALKDFVVLYYNETPLGVQISRILRSSTGEWDPKTRQWTLIGGIEYVLNEEGVFKEIRRFRQQQVRTNKYAQLLLTYSRQDPMSMPFGQLGQYIQLLEEGGQRQDVPFFEVRLYQKWVAPIATVLFTLLGALLGMERIRTNSTYGLTFGALVIFIYSVSVPLSSNVGSLGLLPPWLVAWIPLLLTLVVVALILKLRPQQG